MMRVFVPALLLLAGWAAIFACVGALEFALEPPMPVWSSVFGAHWVHIDSNHALRNALGWSLAVLAMWRRPGLLLVVVCLASVTISMVWALSASIGYAGLSGVLYALWAVVFVGLTQTASTRRAGFGGLACLMLSAFCGSSEVGYLDFQVANLGHQAGLVTGVSIAYLAPAPSRASCWSLPSARRLLSAYIS